MKTLEQFREFVGVTPLQPATQAQVKNQAIAFFKQIKNLLPNPTQFQQAMKYITNIATGVDPQSKIIMQQVMTQPTEPTGSMSPTMPRPAVGTPPSASVGYH